MTIALEQPIITESGDMEIIANLKQLRRAVAEVGIKPDCSIYCGRQGWDYNGKIKIVWRVNMVAYDMPRMIYDGEGETIDDAIAQCIDKIRLDKDVCKVCGGKNGGAFAHKHAGAMPGNGSVA